MEPTAPADEEKAMRIRRLRVVVAALATVAVLLGVAAAAAHGPHWRRHPPPPRANFSLGLEDARGVPLETFRHRGTTWVLGEHGDRYVVVVRNPTAERVEAVISIDGRDAITGRVANFRANRGYIIPPFGTVRVDGFRQSLDRVATFRFTSPGDSYSSRMGTPQNVGVIGVAFFPERVRPLAIPEDREWSRDRRRPSSKASPPRAGASRSDRAAESDSNIGTEYGESRSSRVVEVRFERQSNTPARVITLRYDDARGLERRGIDVFPHPRPHPLPFAPQAFPESRFAPPPP